MSGSPARRVLVLGTAAPQADAIRALRADGVWVAACSWKTEGPGLRLADRFEIADLKDAEAVERFARELGVEALVAVGSDLAMRTAARVSTSLRLPFPLGPALADRLCDKPTWRSELDREGIARVRHRTVRCVRDLAGWDLYPCVVKPADGQGQRGVRLCADRKALEESLGGAARASATARALVEEWLPGPEISLNGFLEQGEVRVCEPSDRLAFEESDAFGIPRAHVYPSLERDDAGSRAELASLLDDVVRCLGLREGPVYAQLKCPPGGAPRLVEVTARLDGCHLWRLIRYAGGPDLLAMTLDQLLGGRTTDGPVGERRRLRLEFELVPAGSVAPPPSREAPGELYRERYQGVGERAISRTGVLEKIGYRIVEEP